jgi:hypothetical protein
VTAQQFAPIAEAATIMAAVVTAFAVWCLVCTICQSRMTDEEYLRSKPFWPFKIRRR